jgi:hypothetical protein
MTIAEFNEKQRTQLAATGATLEMADGSASAVPNPKQRPSRTENNNKKVAAQEKKNEAAVAAEQKREEEKEKNEAAFARDVDECSRCQRRFLTKGQFNLHRRRWCPSRLKQADTCHRCFARWTRWQSRGASIASAA